MARILIVEDEAPLREALAAYLRREGMTVDEASDGESGWRLFRTLPPDLVVLDRRLPGLSGEDLCRRIKGVSKVPVVVATRLIQEEAVLEGFALGADDYVRKPYSAREMTARVLARLRTNGDRPGPRTPHPPGQPGGPAGGTGRWGTGPHPPAFRPPGGRNPPAEGPGAGLGGPGAGPGPRPPRSARDSGPGPKPGDRR